jgi:hypothetical protein
MGETWFQGNIETYDKETLDLAFLFHQYLDLSILGLILLPALLRRRQAPAHIHEQLVVPPLIAG